MFSPLYHSALALLTTLWTAALITAFLLPAGRSAVTLPTAVLYATGGLGCLLIGAWLMLSTDRR